MVRYRKTKPMSLNRLNIILKEQGYQLEKLDTEEIVMSSIKEDEE